MGSITLNFTTIESCDDQGTTLDWENDTNNAQAAAGIGAGETGTNGVPPKEGTGTVEFHSATATATCGIRMINTITAFSVRDNEVGVWFLNPKKNNGENELLALSDSAVRLRLYSGANWADYDQTQWRLADGTWQGGWLYLRASGAAGSESRNSGTWTNTQAAAVDRIGITIETQNTNSGAKDLEYQVDWAKYYDKIIVEGYFDEGGAGERPWSMTDIFNESESGSWGVVVNLENFYKMYCGFDFGDGTVGEFLAENEYVYFAHSSSDVKYDVVFKNNFTLTLGEKNIGTLETYSQNGCQFVASEDAQFPLTVPVKCAPAFTAESGAIVKTFEVLLQGFGTINLGSGGSAACEHRFTDFYDNDLVEWRSTGLIIDASRFHTLGTDKQDLIEMFNVPDTAERITIFNCLDGLTVRVEGALVKELIPLGGSTYDLAIQSTLIDFELRDSDVDLAKIIEVT